MASLSTLPLELLYEIIEILYSLNRLHPFNSVALLRLVNRHFSLISRPFVYREFDGSTNRVLGFLRRLHHDDHDTMDSAYSDVCRILLLLKLPNLKSLDVKDIHNLYTLLTDAWTSTTSPVPTLERLTCYSHFRDPDDPGDSYEWVHISHYLSIMKLAPRLIHFAVPNCFGAYEDNCNGWPNLLPAPMRDIISVNNCSNFTSLEFSRADIDGNFFVWFFGFTKNLKRFLYEFLGFRGTLGSFEDFPQMTWLMTEFKFLVTRGQRLVDALPRDLEFLVIYNSEASTEATHAFLKNVKRVARKYAAGIKAFGESKLKQLDAWELRALDFDSEYNYDSLDCKVIDTLEENLGAYCLC
ncbi:hypothetical protein BDD12DRAFT_805456 [Trichophaea hybrida]|nr:hypothetical protein BDD12DRAFT_805456 [Trichophaea hybrida]